MIAENRDSIRRVGSSESTRIGVPFLFTAVGCTMRMAQLENTGAYFFEVDMSLFSVAPTIGIYTHICICFFVEQSQVKPKM